MIDQEDSSITVDPSSVISRECLDGSETELNPPISRQATMKFIANNAEDDRSKVKGGSEDEEEDSIISLVEIQPEIDHLPINNYDYELGDRPAPSGSNDPIICESKLIDQSIHSINPRAEYEKTLDHPYWTIKGSSGSSTTSDSHSHSGTPIYSKMHPIGNSTFPKNAKISHSMTMTQTLPEYPRKFINTSIIKDNSLNKYVYISVKVPGNIRLN